VCISPSAVRATSRWRTAAVPQGKLSRLPGNGAALKTVSLQVPLLESKRRLQALRPAGRSEQERACSNATAVVARPAVSR